MPVVKYPIRLGLNESPFKKGENKEIRRIAQDYLDSPEKREADRKYKDRIAGAASIMKQVVGYEK
jgi:hypothetical protein